MARFALMLAAALSGCALMLADSTPRKEMLAAVTERNELIRFSAAQPQRVLARVALAGLQPGETLLGIDFRVARGVLYGLGSSGRLYTLDARTGQATALGQPIAVKPEGSQFGFDFNPTVDRIRLVSDAGQNLRLHPDTGALVQQDAAPAYAPGDPSAGRAPRLMAAAYTYNKANDKLTTNFAIDCALGMLVTIGTREGRTPAVSPNTGQLYTVGPLGSGACERASFDIADVDNAALATLGSQLYAVNLDTGAANRIGALAEPLRGLAIEP